MPYALFGLIVLGCVAVLLYICGKPYVAAWWYRSLSDSDPCPPEAAEAPKDELMLLGDTLGFGCPVDPALADAQRIVSGRLPLTAVDELVEQFDWPRYSTWLKEPS